MKKHEKTQKNTINGVLYVFVALFTCLFFVLIGIFFNGKIFAKEETYKTNTSEVYYENSNPIDLNEILEKNTEYDIQEEMCIDEVDLEYTTRYQQTDELSKGTIQVLQEGRAGRKDVIVINKYQNDELISSKQVAENIIKAPVDRIVQIGTGNTVTYKIEKGEKAYVAAETVAVRLEKNENAEKICTLNQDDEVNVINIDNEWLFISNGEIKGYVPINCMTSRNRVQEEVQESKNTYTKQQLLKKLSFDMDLRKPSEFSLEQFKKVLSGDSNDKNSIFEKMAEYFYYSEKQYNINGIFVASVGIHESGWGTSNIAKNKLNLFGYGSADSNPYGGSYTFSTYSEGIDMISRVFVKYYLNPAGTKIYDGTTASGKYYVSPTLSGVNTKYASDKNWSNGVYKWMQYLYNKL